MIQIPKSLDEVPYNHIDFVMADDIQTVLYPELFNILEEIRNNDDKE